MTTTLAGCKKLSDIAVEARKLADDYLERRTQIHSVAGRPMKSTPADVLEITDMIKKLADGLDTAAGLISAGVPQTGV